MSASNMKRLLTIISLTFAPVVALADTKGFGNITEFINFLLGFTNLILPVLGGLALLVFIKGLLVFIAKSGDSASHKDGRDLMIWGLVALFVMVGFLGILTIAKSTLGFNTTDHGIPVLKRQ